MTTYTETFAGMTTGILASNFTERTGASTAYTVEAITDAEDDRAFINDGSGVTGSMLSFDDVDGDANRDNSEILARVRIFSDTDQQFHFWHRASGSAGNRTAYLLWFDAGSGPRWGKYVAESFTALDNGVNLDGTTSPWWWWTSGDQNPSFFNYPADTWLWIRWRINGTGATVTHSVKWWADGQEEPADWVVTDTDTTGDRIVAAGWTAWGRGEAVSSNNTEIDYFSVATNGDTAAIQTSLELGNVRLTQNQISAAVIADNPPVRITQNQISAAVVEANPTVRLTASYLQVVYSYTQPDEPQTGPVLTTNS